MLDPEIVKKAKKTIKRFADYQYFFDQLNTPDWIDPLWKEGFFRNPPPPIEEGKYVRFPVWPESQYLVRMTAHKPEEVLDIILQIPDTGNVRIYADLADAALKMPPELAVRLLDKAKVWAQSPYQSFLWDKLGRLIVHYARGGQVEAALELASVFLEILPDPRPREESEKEEILQLAPRPQTRLSEWDYGEFLEHFFPELLKEAGIGAFTLLCDLLEAYVRLSRRRPEEQGPEDYSFIWRPAIEEHPQNFSHGLKDFMVAAIRDSAETLVRENKAETRRLVQHLEKRPWRIFHRIALHIMNIYWDAIPDIGAKRLLDEEQFKRRRPEHEYSRLLEEHFDKLAEEQKQKFFEWIEAGPDLNKFKESVEQDTGKRPTDDDAQRFKKTWQQDHLALIRAHLEKEWKQRYEELLAEYGEPELPVDFPFYGGPLWGGPTSPKSAEELQGMSVADIVQLLKNWQPSGKDMEPTPEGLGRVLASAIGQDPSKFAAEAAGFKGLDPTYIRSLIEGLRDGLKQGRSFKWPLVLDLCTWVIGESIEIPGRQFRDDLFADPNWGWARKAIADLLAAGFDKNAIPFDLRDKAWSILEPLTGDPEPTPDDEAKSTMSPADLSINRTRGEAMHAVFRYALWVARSIEKLPDGSERRARGFEEMTEVREVLNKRLDTTEEPSLAIRSVYGQWLPRIVLLDRNWAQANVAKIFPKDKSQKVLHDTAWAAYVTFNRPSAELFDILNEQYAAAVDRLDEPAQEAKPFYSSEESLSEHMMAFYWRGKLDLADPKGMLAQFWARANEQLRGHVLVVLGRWLYDIKESISPDVLERLRTLWEARLAVAKAAQAAEGYKAEMIAFGWWFASGKFDDAWALSQLDEVLKIASKAEPDHLVLERLAALAPAMPRQVVNCMEGIIRGDREGWGIYRWRDEGRQILSIALRSGDKEAAANAVNLIHLLGSRGYFEFRDLLPSPL